MDKYNRKHGGGHCACGHGSAAHCFAVVQGVLWPICLYRQKQSRGSATSAFRRYPGGFWGILALSVVTSKFVFFFACLLDLYFSLLDAQVGLQKPSKSTSEGFFLAASSLNLFPCLFPSKICISHVIFYKDRLCREPHSDL